MLAYSKQTTTNGDYRMQHINDTITRAIEIKKLNNLSFVTIWKTGKSFGFNFDKKPMGYKTKEYGVVREVVGIY